MLRTGLKRSHDHPGRTMDLSGGQQWTLRSRVTTPYRFRSATADRMTAEEHRGWAAEEQRAEAQTPGRLFVGDALAPASRNVLSQIGTALPEGAPRLITRNDFVDGPSGGGLQQFSTEPRTRITLDALQREQFNRETVLDVVSSRKRNATHLVDPYADSDRAVNYTEARPFKRTMRGDASAMRDTPTLPPPIHTRHGATQCPTAANGHSGRSPTDAAPPSTARERLRRFESRRHPPRRCRPDVGPRPHPSGPPRWCRRPRHGGMECVDGTRRSTPVGRRRAPPDTPPSGRQRERIHRPEPGCLQPRGRQRLLRRRPTDPQPRPCEPP